MQQNPVARLGALALACLALVAVFADVLASDLPIACRFKGNIYLFPAITEPTALVSYDHERLQAERSPGDWAISPLVKFGPQQTSTHGAISAVRSPDPLGEHPFGTDAYGRDVFARLIYGARTSLGAALFATLGFISLGAVLGALRRVLRRHPRRRRGAPGGDAHGVPHAGPRPRRAGARPHPSLGTLLLAIGLTRWPEVARLVRAEVVLASSQDYVMAARALGVGPWRILRRHVLPNALAPILVAATVGLASVVLIEASLDFLRVGTPEGSASWGETLSETREHLGAWWLLVFPGVAVFVTVMALNLVGEALRDALDPRLRAMVGGVES